MFYSEAILARRGPLAKVWLAAHMERKLTKAQTLQTDIEQSVEAIVGQEIEVMALRLSGQLLLGVVRIYSRKAKYLLDDCNEALLKIKMAFKPGLVDMTEEQLKVKEHAITLQGSEFDLDMLLPDVNWDMDFDDQLPQPQGHHVAREADITLANADDLQFDLNDPGYGWDLGPSDGIGSQDFDLDLGLDFGDRRATSESQRSEDESMDIETGRDAQVARSARESLDSHVLGRRGADLDFSDALSQRSRELSEHPFPDDMKMDIDFGPVDMGGDMGLDLGLDFELHQSSDREKTPGQTRSTSSPLTTPPATPPPGHSQLPAEGAPQVEGVQPSDVTPKEKGKRKPKEKKQIIDSIIELEEGPGGRSGRGRPSQVVAKDVSGILSPQHLLPRSALVARLLEIRADPLAHFLPTKHTPHGTFFCAAPPGMAPELTEMFMRPLRDIKNAGGAKRRGGLPSPERASKKPRLDTEGPAAEDDMEIELARRQSMAPSVGLGSELLGGRGSVGPDLGLDLGNDNTLGLDDFQMDLGELNADVGFDRARSRSAPPSELTRLSRLSTPALSERDFYEDELSYADANCPIAMFDTRSQQQSQTQTQTQTQDAEVEIVGEGEGKGYSRNTVKALSVIRKELQPDPEVEEGEEVMSFKKMSEKASRRAASSFFFELLVLGTRDCVKLSQAAPFENIEIRAKAKLWERQRHGSVAPSIVEEAMT